MPTPYQFSRWSKFWAVVAVAMLCLIALSAMEVISVIPPFFLILIGGVALCLAGTNDSRGSILRQVMRAAGILMVLYILAKLLLVLFLPRNK